MATTVSIARLFVVAGMVVAGGCAADQPSKPMAPVPKPTPASSASTAMRSAPQAPAKPPAPAPKGNTARAPVAASSKPATQPSPAPSADSQRSIAPSANARQAEPSNLPSTLPAATTPAPAPQAASNSAASAQAPITADFSTGLLFPDPDPANAANRQIALCEFIGGRWTPIMSAPVQTYGGDSRGVTFRGVLARRMVLPAYMVNGEALPAANPWIVESSGKARELKGPCATCPSTEPPILTLELRPAEGVAAAPMTPESGDYGVIAVRAQPGRPFTLSYWDNAWVPIGDVTLTAGQPVRIEGVPSKRVLWLKSENDSLTLPVVP